MLSLLQWIPSTGIGLVLGYLAAWFNFREKLANARRAELELKDFKDKAERLRVERESDDSMPKYIEAVSFAFATLTRAHTGANAMSLTRLAKEIDATPGFTRRVAEVMVQQGRLQSQPSPFTPGETDYVFKP